MIWLVLIGIAIAIFRGVESALWYAAGVVLAYIFLAVGIGKALLF